MRFGILGPVEVAAAGRFVSIGQPRHRAVLAYLLLHRHQTVTFAQLIEALWGGAEPRTAKSQLHVAVSSLRGEFKRLGFGEVIVSRPGGYQAVVADDDLDAGLFARRVRAARQAAATGDHEASADLLGDAMRLWRGDALAGIQAAFVPPARHLLTEHRLEAVELLAEAQLALDRPELVIALVGELIEEHPLRENLVGQLMLAMQRCGRSAEALDRFHRLRTRLADEYGCDPGPRLQRLHLELLRGTGPPTPSDMRGPDPAIPRQLPASVANFCGRAHQLAQLDRLADPSTRPNAAVAAIVGTAGVGKTALALHWAHRVAHLYPDGQLYLNLRGYDQAGPPMEPAEAVRCLLDALAPADHRIPAGRDAQVGLLRSILAGRRVLLVLDNARDTDQVRPLLPGSPSCLVVVTSRNQLSGLIAVEGADPVTLDLLSTADARDLIAARLGRERIAAEPGAVDEIIERCSRLPLALAILSARAATYPGFALRGLADELRDAQATLDALSDADASTDLRTVFSWSYQTLKPDAALVFRHAGRHPGPDFDLAAMASLTGMPVRRVRPLLADLIRANLAAEHTPGRYALHDLLRAFASELAGSVDGEAMLEASLRLLDHYLHLGFAADRLLQPHRQAIELGQARNGVTADPPAEVEAALAWFAGERPAMLAAMDWAVMNGHDQAAWRLAWTMENFFDLRGRWPEWVQTQLTALAAAQRTADVAAQIHSHRSLAIAMGRLGRYDEAHAHFQHTAALSTDVGDPATTAWSHRAAAGMLEQQGLYHDGLHHALKALELSRGLTDRISEARTLNMIGWLRARLGDFTVALGFCQQALRLLNQLGNRHALAHTFHSLGYIHHHLGDPDQARIHYEKAVDLFHSIGNRYKQAEALVHFGESRQAAGDHDTGIEAWRDALTIFEELGHPAAAQLRQRLGEI